jgi:hypothetical protein
MTTPDVFAAMLPVIEAFEASGVSYILRRLGRQFDA